MLAVVKSGTNGMSICYMLSTNCSLSFSTISAIGGVNYDGSLANVKNGKPRACLPRA